LDRSVANGNRLDLHKSTIDGRQQTDADIRRKMALNDKADGHFTPTVTVSVTSRDTTPVPAARAVAQTPAASAPPLAGAAAPPRVNVFVGTWNLHAKDPPAHLDEFIPRNRHDVYVLGTEECQNTIAKSILFASKRRWVKALQALLGNDYVCLGEESLVAIHIVAFARRSLVDATPQNGSGGGRAVITGVETARHATGIGDVLGNKGGVGLCFDVGGTSFAFVNCHFHAHQDAVAERNGDYVKIDGGLSLRPAQTHPLRTGDGRAADTAQHHTDADVASSSAASPPLSSSSPPPSSSSPSSSSLSASSS
jgi:hypothetical protein